MSTPLLLVEGLHLNCAVPHCRNLACGVTALKVDSSSNYKKVLPVCESHMPVLMRSRNGVEFDAKDALDDLKKLHGLPPHDGFNPCFGDGHFLASLPVKYDVSVHELETLLEIPRLLEEWRTARAEFAKRK